MDQTLITRIVEAALLAAHQPLTLAQLHALFPDDEPAPAGSVEHAMESLSQDCAGRGVELVELASGFRYQVQADVHPWVARLWTERQTRYTRATLETLALIAYRQPITRGEIEQVRGVAVSSNIIKALEEREWIRVVGHRDVPGKPALFGTTRTFLDYFGLKRLDELPPLSELKELGDLEPQFQFDGVPSAGSAIAAGGLGALATPGAGGEPASSETDGAGLEASDAAAGNDDSDLDAPGAAAPASGEKPDMGDAQESQQPAPGPVTQQAVDDAGPGAGPDIEPTSGHSRESSSKHTDDAIPVSSELQK